MKNIKESKKNRGIRQKTSQNPKNYAKTFKQWILSKTFIKKRKWETQCEKQRILTNIIKKKKLEPNAKTRDLKNQKTRGFDKKTQKK